jgi:hypothetical protein
MGATRAKFSVSETNSFKANHRKEGTENEYEQREGKTIKLSPVYGNNDPNHENSKFWNATPSGAIELTFFDLEAATKFKLQQQYYFDISQEPPTPGGLIAVFKVESIGRSLGSKPIIEAGTGKQKWVSCEQRTIRLVRNGWESEKGAAIWSGRIELGVINLPAAEMFDLGLPYYVKITPAE